MIRLIRGDEIHDPGVASGCLQDSHLMGDLGPAVSTSTPLPDELSSKHFSRGLIHAALHHRKLPPDEPKSHAVKDISHEDIDRQSTGNQKDTICCWIKASECVSWFEITSKQELSQVQQVDKVT